MSTAIIKTTSTGLALNDGPTVLGERPARIPTAGKIRPGIKVPTKAVATNKEAMRIYQEGVAAQKSFGVIEADIRRLIKADKMVLVPKNVSYFTVRRCDFVVPEIADMINSRFSEDGPEGRHIYRLPIVFPVDFWQAVLPHALQMFTRSERVYWSQYGPDGKRYCMTHGKLELDARSQRARRPYGGRPTVLRENEHGGLCVPDSCQEYQAGTCKLSGALVFYIKGIPGGSAFEMPMTSFYGMQGIRQQMELILHTHGRLAGITFYLTKQQQEVSRLDLENGGKAMKTSQWITTLEAEVDMARLLTHRDVAGGAEAAAVLEGPGHTVDAGPPQGGAEAAAANAEANPSMSIEEMQKIVTEKIHALGLKFGGEYTPYAAEKWGANWTADPEALSKIVDELDSVEDVEAYQNQVRSFDIPF
jgi:hypothetical protein